MESPVCRGRLVLIKCAFCAAAVFHFLCKTHVRRSRFPFYQLAKTSRRCRQSVSPQNSQLRKKEREREREGVGEGEGGRERERERETNINNSLLSPRIHPCHSTKQVSSKNGHDKSHSLHAGSIIVPPPLYLVALWGCYRYVLTTTFITRYNFPETFTLGFLSSCTPIDP